MDQRNEWIGLDEIKLLDMVTYLSSLGFEPNAKMTKGDNFWYISPLPEHDEKTPSFKVDRGKNVWYDHGIGKGGNLVDFALLYFGCTVKEFLYRFNNNFSFQQLPKSTAKHRADEPEEEKIILETVGPIRSYGLVKYLNERGIPLRIAEQYCKEVHYIMNAKKMFGIGFPNDGGGYEIRTPFYKTGSKPKGITTIKNGSPEVATFEGFMDFLSFICLHQKDDPKRLDYLILNSASFIEMGIEFMAQYDRGYLYLDNDKTGQKCTEAILAQGKQYVDERGLYKGYKDLNKWLTDFETEKKLNTGLKR